MKYMLATLCSKPAATKAEIGKTMAQILSTTLRLGERKPDGQADQNVAQNAFEKCVPERHRPFCGGDFHYVNSDRIAIHLPVVREINQQHQSESAVEIGQIDDHPVLQ